MVGRFFVVVIVDMVVVSFLMRFLISLLLMMRRGIDLCVLFGRKVVWLDFGMKLSFFWVMLLKEIVRFRCCERLFVCVMISLRFLLFLVLLMIDLDRLMRELLLMIVMVV